MYDKTPVTLIHTTQTKLSSHLLLSSEKSQQTTRYLRVKYCRSILDANLKWDHVGKSRTEEQSLF